MIFLVEPISRPAVATALGVAAALVAWAVVVRWRRRHARPVLHAPGAAPVAAEPAPGSADAEVLALFGDLRPGAVLAQCTISGIYTDDRGCIPVVLAAPDGTAFRIDVLRRDPEDPEPPAQTERLALYLSGMPSRARTPPECHRAARLLAHVLAEVGAEPPAWLLTLREHTIRLRDAVQPRA